MRVVLISGKARHGKDTTAQLMGDRLTELGYRVLTTHFGDLVKFICSKYLEWDGEKDDYGRRLLQTVGTEVVRAQDEDYWARFVYQVLTFFRDEWDYVLIPDTRFQNEIDLAAKFGFKSTHIRVERPDFDSNLSENAKNHPSETALDDVKPEFYLQNPGVLEAFESNVWEIVEELIKQEN